MSCGISKIAQKVGKEAADLVCRPLVLLMARGYRFDDVDGVLCGRHK